MVVQEARCLLGMDLHAPLGIRTTQVRNPRKKGSPKKINSIELPNTDDWVSENWKNAHAEKFALVFNRLGRSKNLIVTTQIFTPSIPYKRRAGEFRFTFLTELKRRSTNYKLTNQSEN